MQHESEKNPEETARDPEFVASADKRAGRILIGVLLGALVRLVGVELIRRVM